MSAAGDNVVTPELALVDPGLAKAKRQIPERKAAMSSTEPSNGTFFVDQTETAPAPVTPEPTPPPAPAPVTAVAAAPPVGVDPGSSPMLDVPLGTLIFRAGLLAEEQLEDALQEGMRTGKRLGEVLLERGWLHERDLGRMLAGQKGLPFVEVSASDSDPEARQVIPEEKARLQVALPLRYEDGQLVVAVADPSNELVLENLRRTLGAEPRLVVAAYTDLIRAIGEAYASPSAQPAAPLPGEPALATAPEASLQPEPEPVQSLTATAPAPTPLPTVIPPAEERFAQVPDAPSLQPPVAEPTAPATEQTPLIAPPTPAVEESSAPLLEPPAVEQAQVAEETPRVAVPAPPVADETPVMAPPTPTVQESAVPLLESPAGEPVASVAEEVPHVAPPTSLAEESPAPLLEPPAVEPDTATVEPAVPPLLQQTEPSLEATPVMPVEPLVEAFEAQPVSEATHQPTALIQAPVEQPAVAPAEPLLQQPVAPPAPEPSVPAVTDEPTRDATGSHTVLIRLRDGDVLEVGSFPTAAEASNRAQEVVAQIAAAEGAATWPFFAERYLRPDTIVSVDLVEQTPDQWMGSSARRSWANNG